MTDNAIMTMMMDRFQSLEQSMERARQESADSRRAMYAKQDETSTTLIRMDIRVQRLEQEILGMQPALAEVAKIRAQAAGAGRLGVFIWSVGKYLIAAAAAVVSFYIWFTGMFTLRG